MNFNAVRLVQVGGLFLSVAGVVMLFIGVRFSDSAVTTPTYGQLYGPTSIRLSKMVFILGCYRPYAPNSKCIKNYVSTLS